MALRSVRFLRHSMEVSIFRSFQHAWNDGFWPKITITLNRRKGVVPNWSKSYPVEKLGKWRKLFFGQMKFGIGFCNFIVSIAHSFYCVSDPEHLFSPVGFWDQRARWWDDGETSHAFQLKRSKKPNKLPKIYQGTGFAMKCIFESFEGSLNFTPGAQEYLVFKMF